MKQSYFGIGTMSGTSLDGLDLAYCRFDVEDDQYGFELIHSRQIPYDERWYRRLSLLIEQDAETYARTHVYFGHWLGEQIRSFINERALEVDFVACHGQTIFHQPDKNFTAQIGDGESIAAYLPCLLVCNFRNKDVALKGEGAPLIPLVEQYLFPHHKLFLNLGGFANAAYDGTALDIGSCNGVLNYLFSEAFPNAETNYDPEGQFSAGGNLNGALLNALNAIPFYQLPAPKSLGWEWVRDEVLPLLHRFSLPIQDMMHTYVHHIAFQIARSIESLDCGSQKMLITGGGAHNVFLITCLEKELLKIGVEIERETPSDWIDYKEAIGFAFLGLRCLQGKETIVQNATGAQVAAVTGSIHVPPGGYPIFSSFVKQQTK